MNRSLLLLVPVALVALVAAAPPHADPPDELVRRANELYRGGDAAGAERLYAAAEERTGDPGLVAFNRGAVLFDRVQYREAEKQYARALDDAACPPERAAKAWYNRGTALLRRGGSASVYRSAVACFENALDSPAADPDLKRRAAHNLELAKLAWDEERKKANKPEDRSPNADPPPEENRQNRPDRDPAAGTEPDPNGTDPNGTGTKPKVQQQPVPVPKGHNGAPNQTNQQTAGNNPNLEVLRDSDTVQKLTPDEARRKLEAMAERRKRERRAMLETLAGPDRPGVLDW